MAYDHTEAEQLEEFKAFWRKHGNTILTILTVVLLAVAAWRGWAWYQSHRAGQASVVYHQLKVAVEARDVERIRSTAGVLRADFGGTVYAPMGALVAADALASAGSKDAARDALARMIEDDTDHPGFVLSARLRLAALLIEQKAWDDAARVLETDVPASYEGLFADRRGDLAAARGQVDEAREAWRKALETLGPAAPIARVVQLKLDSLGSGS